MTDYRQVTFDREAYRRRNVVGRCVGRLKENRRRSTRHENMAPNSQAMAALAAVRLCFRKLDSPDRT